MKSLKFSYVQPFQSIHRQMAMKSTAGILEKIAIFVGCVGGSEQKHVCF